MYFASVNFKQAKRSGKQKPITGQRAGGPRERKKSSGIRNRRYRVLAKCEKRSTKF